MIQSTRWLAVLLISLLIVGSMLSVRGAMASPARATKLPVPRGIVAGWIFFRTGIPAQDGSTATVRILYWDDDQGRYLQQQQTVTAAAALHCAIAAPISVPYSLSGSCYVFNNVPKSTYGKSRPFVIQVYYDSTHCQLTINDSFAWYNPSPIKWEGIVTYKRVVNGSGRYAHTCH